MKPTSKESTDRRTADRRTPPSERRADGLRAAAGERRVVDKRGIGEAMVDALEDILHWERASERTLKAAERASTTDVTS